MSHRLVTSSSFKISSIVQNLNFRVQAVKIAIIPSLRESSTFIVNDNPPSSINGTNKLQDQADALADAMILNEDDVLPQYINKDIEVPEDDVGPGADKHGKYKNVEYFRYNRYSFYDKMQQALAFKLEREESEGATYMMDQLMEKEKAKLQTDKIVEDTIKATEASEGLMARSMSTLIYFPLFLRTEPYSMDADNSAKTHIMGWIKSLEDKKNKSKDSRDDKMPEEEISAADSYLHDKHARLFADESKDFDEEEQAKKPSHEQEDIFEEQTDKPAQEQKETNMSDEMIDAEQIQQEVINLLNSKLAKRIQQTSQAKETCALEDEQNNLYEISLDKLEREAEMNLRLKEHRLSGGYVGKQTKNPSRMDTNDDSDMHQKDVVMQQMVKDKYLFNKAVSSSGRQDNQEEPLDPFEEQLASSGQVEQEQEAEQLADRAQMMSSMQDEEQLDPFEEKPANEKFQQQSPAIPKMNNAHMIAYAQNEALDPFEERLASDEMEYSPREEQEPTEMAHIMTTKVKESLDPFEEHMAGDEVTMEDPVRAEIDYAPKHASLASEDAFEQQLVRAEGGDARRVAKERKDPLQKLLVKEKVSEAPTYASVTEDPLQKHLAPAEVDNAADDASLEAEMKSQNTSEMAETMVDPLQKHLVSDKADYSQMKQHSKAEMAQMAQMMADQLQPHVTEADNSQKKPQNLEMSQVIEDKLQPHLTEADYSQNKPQTTAEMTEMAQMMTDPLKQHVSEVDYSQKEPQTIEEMSEMSEMIEDKLQEHLVPQQVDYSENKSQKTAEMSQLDDPLKHLIDEADYSEVKPQNLEQMSEMIEDKLQEHLVPNEADYSQKQPEVKAEMSEMNDPLKHLVQDEADFSQKKPENTAEMSQLNDQLKQLLVRDAAAQPQKTAEIAETATTPKEAEGIDVHNLVKPIHPVKETVTGEGDGKAQEKAEMSQMIEELRAAMDSKKQLYSQDLAEMSQMMSNLMAEVENHMRSLSNAAKLNSQREQETGANEQTQMNTETTQKLASDKVKDSVPEHLVADFSQMEQKDTAKVATAQVDVSSYTEDMAKVAPAEVDNVSSYSEDMAKVAPMLDDPLQKHLVNDEADFSERQPTETAKVASVENADFTDPLKEYLVIDKTAEAPEEDFSNKDHLQKYLVIDKTAEAAVEDLANKDPLQEFVVPENQQVKVIEKPIMADVIPPMPAVPEVAIEDPLQKHVLRAEPVPEAEQLQTKKAEMFDNATMHVLGLKDPLQEHLVKQQQAADELDNAYMSALSRRKPIHPLDKQQLTGDGDHSLLHSNTNSMSVTPMPPMEVDDDAYMHALDSPEQMAPLEHHQETSQDLADQSNQSNHADTVFDNLVEKEFLPDAEEYEASNDADHHESPFDRIVGVNQCLDAAATFGLHSDPSEFAQMINSALDGMAEYEEKYGIRSHSKNIEALTSETMAHSDPDIKEIGSFSKPFIIPFPEFTSPEDFSTKEHPRPLGAEESTSAEESLPTITLVAREMSESEEKHPSESEIAHAAKELIIKKRAKLPVIGKFNGDTEEMEYNTNTVFTRPSRFPRTNARSMDEIVYRSSLD